MTPAGYHLCFGRAIHCQLLKHFSGLRDVLAHVVSKQQGVGHLLLGPLVALVCNYHQFLIQPGRREEEESDTRDTDGVADMICAQKQRVL